INAEEKGKAESAATELSALFNRGVSGLVRLNFPEAARGSGDVFPKEVSAIRCAKILCEHFRRLPTKAEVRTILEHCGVRYSKKSKGFEGNWRGLFDRAGLNSLPD